MTIELRMRLLFLLAWASRMLLAPLATVWLCIGIAVLLGVPISWAADSTAIVLAIVVVAGVIVFSVFGRHPGVVARMRRGPASIVRHPYMVILAGSMSHVGGIALSYHGESEAGHWAMAMGTAVVICEISALAGAAYCRILEPPESAARGDADPSP